MLFRSLVNMSFQLNSSIHNTQWVTGHFHLIYAGAIVIMYFATLLSASGVVKSGPGRWAEEAWCASTGGSS